MSGGRNGARLLVQNLAALHADVIHFMSGRNSIVSASGPGRPARVKVGSLPCVLGGPQL